MGSTRHASSGDLLRVAEQEADGVRPAPAHHAAGDDLPYAAEATTLRAPDSGMFDVERALRLVRMATALITIAAVIGARGSESSVRGPIAGAAIFGGALLINLFTSFAQKRGWNAVSSLGGEILDVAGSLGLVILLEPALAESAWMVLLLPIVMGGVRMGAGGTLLGWMLACAGYLALVLTGVIDVEGETAQAFGNGLRQMAFLLALAVPVAALTQWLQQRWEHQRALTVAASLRAQRLELVESLARSFIGSSEPKLLANAADAGVRLGFETVTITLHVEDRSMTAATLGASRRLPTEDVTLRPAPGETLVTQWNPDGRGEEALTSVSILLAADGNQIALHGWSSEPVDDDLARSFGLLGAHASVALRAARMLADLERQATQDPLTGLRNRRAFDDHIDERSRTERAVALLVLDVDRFKEINDGYGHPAGDRVLRVISQRLLAAADVAGPTAESVVARIGGDEFAMVLTDVPLETVASVADRIESSMQAPVAVGPDLAVPVSFSIGIADADGQWTPRELISAADEAVYQAKEHGRNRTCWSPEALGTGPRVGRTLPRLDTDEFGDQADPLILSLERAIDGPSTSRLPAADLQPTTTTRPTP